MRGWHGAAPRIMGPSLGYLNAIDSGFERRKNHRMLLKRWAIEIMNWELKSGLGLGGMRSQGPLSRVRRHFILAFCHCFVHNSGILELRRHGYG
jgi:hypothetical protein